MCSKRYEIRLLLALILLPLLVQSQRCSAGCLNCGSDNNCRVCDLSSFHALQNGACVHVIGLTNCLLIDTSGKCVLCTKEYYVDPATYKCVSINSENKVTNCAVYTSSKTCSACESGYYIQNSICLGTGISIPNCTVQVDATTCVTCKPGYVMQPGGGSCIELPTGSENCAAFSFVNCKACTTNHLLDRNKYIKDFATSISTNTNIDPILATILNEKRKEVNQGFKSVCLLLNLENCAEYLTENRCKKCVDGFFLTESYICQTNPQPSISNCKVYSSPATCIRCESGFFVNSRSGCSTVINIPRCADYDPSALKSACLKCNDDSFLLSSSTCTLRGRPNIENCSQYDIESDQCAVCSQGYHLTDDGGACLTEIPNCELYNVSINTSIKHTCKLCSNGYYLLSDVQCQQGTIQFCETYRGDLNECITCKNEYYLSATTVCSSHDSVSSCGIYDNLEKNKCLKCTNKNLGFDITNKCITALAIPGCVVYSSDSTCQLCDQGYFLSGTICNQLPANINCLEATSFSNCTKCAPNYIIYNGTCRTLPLFLLDNCEANNISTGKETLDTAKCSFCNNSSINWAFDRNYICLETEWLASLQSASINNCAQFSINGSSTVCVRCNTGYHLSSNTCVQTCGANPIITNDIVLLDGKYQITSGKFCNRETFTSKIDNCAVYSYANNLTTGDINADPICVKCNTNYYKVIDPTSTNSTGMEDPDYQSSTDWGFSAPVAFLPKINSCVLLSTSGYVVRLAPSGVTYIDGCEYYQLVATNTYACVRCKTGKRGTLGNTINGDFISTCATTTCNSTFIPGLSAKLNSYVSCYKCVDTSSIPFLFIKGGTTYSGISGYKSYSLTVADWDSVTNGGYNVNCHPRDGSGFTNITNFGLPANCAIAAFNVESTSSSAENAKKTSLATADSLAVFCIACEPGYKRSKGTLSTGVEIPHFVYGCVAIPNCLQKDWINYCSLCSDGYAFLYSDTNGIDYSVCVSFAKDTNCLATRAAITGPCAVCKKGFTANYDGICESLPVPFCQNGAFSPAIKFNRVDFGTMFYQSPLGSGCHKCNTGYAPVKIPFGNNTCVKSDYIALVNTLDTTQYIRYCANYFNENKELKCMNCTTGYVRAANKIECLPSTQLTNCLLALTNVECQSCLTGYVSVQYKCQKATISNCLAYELKPSQTKQTCLHCNIGYYLKDNTCVQGTLNSCNVYTENGDGCLACADGYALVKAYNRDYCFKTPSDRNCDTYDISKFDSNILECTKCSSSTPLYLSNKLENESSFICLPINDMAGCEEFINDGTLAGSTLLCKKCTATLYLSKGVCIIRTKLNPNCESYDFKSDNCLACKSGFYLSSNNCIPNPSGIGNCRLYLSDSICFACNSNYYLLNNACVQVPDESIINNCVYYINPKTCSECKVGFALSVGICIQTAAQNCLTVKSATQCDTCDSKRGLKTENGITSCIANTDTNCLSFVQVFPFVCSICKIGFYPDPTGLCVKVNQTISSCEVYDSATTCSKCTRGFALSGDKIKCTNSSEIKSFIGSTCENSLVTLNPTCTQCRAGYVFSSDGSCKQTCGNGCHFCDPENPEACLLCATSNYMDNKGACVASTAVDNSGSSSAGLTKVFTALALLILALLNK